MEPDDFASARRAGSKREVGGIADHGRSAERDLAAYLEDLRQGLDRSLPANRRVMMLWAMAKASRNLAPGGFTKSEFTKLARDTGLVVDVGVHGEDDIAHVLGWATRGWNPFEKGDLT
jgi:hypothetical protein